LASKTKLFKDNFSILSNQNHFLGHDQVDQDKKTYGIITLSYPSLLTSLLSKESSSNSIDQLLFLSFAAIRHATDSLISRSINTVARCPNPIHEGSSNSQTLLDVEELRQTNPKTPSPCCDSASSPCLFIYCGLCDTFHSRTAKCEWTYCNQDSGTTAELHPFSLDNRVLLSEVKRKTVSTPCPHPGCVRIFCAARGCKRWHAKNDPSCDTTLCSCSPAAPPESKATLSRLLASNPAAVFKCRHCGNYYCSICTSWHNDTIVCIDVNKFKSCPTCKAPTELRDGCSHITCRCGTHWCFKCDNRKSPAFSSGSECYAHLQKYHGGFY